jgi:SOS response regulatory protein OraA/RecX
MKDAGRKKRKQDIIVEATNAEISYVRQKIKEARKAKKEGDTEEFNKIVDTLIDRGYPKDFIMDALK